MSYALRFYGEFKNYYNIDCRVEFYLRDFANPSTEIKLIGVEDTYNGDDRDIFNPIFGREMAVTILSETDFQFIEFHSSDSRKYRMDYYEDDNLIFSGWVLPDLFSEPYIAAPYPIKITARCGLGELKESYFGDTINKLRRSESSSVVATTTPDLFSIIANALLSIETDLKLNEAISVYSGVNDTINYSPIADTSINLESFEYKTVYDAVSDILRSFGARLYQMDGEWWIVRIKEFKETLSVRKWTLSETEVNTFTTDETKLTTFRIGRPVDSHIVNNSPMLDILPAWKEASINQSFGKVDNLFINGDFSSFESIDQEIEWFPYDANGIVYKPITDWETPATGRNKTPALINWKDGTRFIDMLQSRNIFQTIENIDYGAYAQIPYANVYKQRFRFSIDTALIRDSDKYFFKVSFLLSGSINYYLSYNSSNRVYEWTTTPSTLIIQDLPTSDWENSGELTFNTTSFETDLIPIDGDLTVTIEDPYEGGAFISLKVKNAKLEIVKIDNYTSEEVDYDESDLITETINENNIYTESPNETVCGDLPDIPNNTNIYKYGYRTNSGNATAEWHDRGSTTEKPLLELLLDDYQTFYNTPQFKLSLPILSQNIKFDSSIVDYQVLSKKYICNSATIDRVNSIFSGVFFEFGTWEGADWILEDGNWDDNGVWKDDETWNDF